MTQIGFIVEGECEQLQNNRNEGMQNNRNEGMQNQFFFLYIKRKIQHKR